MTEPHDPASDLVGTVLAGRYRILELLGVGAMGAVYLGEHVKMGRRDAIKVLRDSLATDREATLRFLRGARNVSAIRHPNVCTIYDFSDTADGLQFLAMELVPGETLKDALDREGRLSLERAVHIAAQTADALQAAHDAGIVHRDLKPGNIMLGKAHDGRDQVKVVDFDIAKGSEAEGEEVTRTGFVVGTPEYMSPEQLMGEHLDGRSDVYSLAIMLFRMLAGSLPFRAATTQDVMIQRLTHRPLRLDEAIPGVRFPERLQHAIDRALERRATDRWASAAEFGHEIAAAIAAPGAVWSAPAAHAAAAPPLPAPPELPATRVAPAPSVGGHAPTVVTPAVGHGRRNLAIGAALTIALALGAGAVLLNGGTAPPDENDRVAEGSNDQVTAPVTSAADSQALGAVPPPPVIGRAQDEPPGPAGRTPAGGGDREDPDAARPQPDSATRSTIDVTAPPVIVLAPGAVADLLLQQIVRLSAETPPAPAELAAMMDTARAVWDLRTLPDTTRARGAYVLGNLYNARSDWPRCAAWMDSAIALSPNVESYTRVRNLCRDQIR